MTITAHYDDRPLIAAMRGLKELTKMGLDLSLARKRESFPDICLKDGEVIEESDWDYQKNGDWDEQCSPWEYPDDSHVYHAGYVTLHVIRRYIANVEGIPDLDAMPGFRDSSMMYKYRPGFEPDPGDWSKYQGVLMPLLTHSDCDGELSPDECKQMAPRLRQILDVAPTWVNRYAQIKDLVEGIERAAAEDLWILFR